jgi:hypothetical protein
VSYKGIQGGISSGIPEHSESKSQSSTTILAELDVSVYELTGPSSSTAFQDSVGLQTYIFTDTNIIMTSVPTATLALKQSSRPSKRKVEKKERLKNTCWK